MLYIQCQVCPHGFECRGWINVVQHFCMDQLRPLYSITRSQILKFQLIFFTITFYSCFLSSELFFIQNYYSFCDRGRNRVIFSTKCPPPLWFVVSSQIYQYFYQNFLFSPSAGHFSFQGSSVSSILYILWFRLKRFLFK